MFAEVVRANRQRLGLTQEELASKAGLSPRTIRKIEANRIGSPRPTTVRLLADALGLVDADRERFYQTAAGNLSAPPGSTRAPAQLPADVSAFTGRAEQLAHLDALLTRAADQANAVIISALSGTAGVGKTALAIHWAHRVRDKFPDGQLYVNLRGYDPEQPMDPADALAGFLSALGVAGQDVPPDLGERAARYRSEVADRRMLIVLDNAGGVEQVRPLLPGGSACTVVVTSRDSLAGLVAVHGAHRLELDLLPAAEATRLLRRLIGYRVDAEPEAAATLVEQCARLPLALRIAAELAAARASVPLADLAAELGDWQRRLEVLDGGGDPRAAVRTVFSWSIQHLPPGATGMFRLLGLHPGPDIEPYAAAALADTSLELARDTLVLLTRAHLLHLTGRGRYGIHDLLRAYAAERTRIHDTDQARHAAVSRLLDHYRHTASVAMDIAYSYESGRRPRVQPASDPTPDFSNPTQATDWLDVELPNLLAAARLGTSGWHEHTLDLSAILHRHLRTRGRYREAAALHDQALTSAHVVGRRAGELDALVSLGEVNLRLGRHQQAIDHYRRALEVARTTGSQNGEVDALNGLGWVHWRQGRQERALEHFRPALEIARATGNRTGELDALIGFGDVHLLQGQHEQAVDYYQQAWEIARATGNRTGELEVLNGLGWIHFRQGRHEQALDHFTRALEIARTTGNSNGQLNALVNLGSIYFRQGRHEQALDHYTQALEIARATGNRTGQLHARCLLGNVHRQLGTYEQAADLYQQVFEAATETGDLNWQFEALYGLGRLRQTTGQPDAALAHHRQALRLATELRQPGDRASALDGLAHAEHALHQYELARRHWQEALDILTSLGIDHTEDGEASVSTIHANLAAVAVADPRA